MSNRPKNETAVSQRVSPVGGHFGPPHVKGPQLLERKILLSLGDYGTARYLTRGFRGSELKSLDARSNFRFHLSKWNFTFDLGGVVLFGDAENGYG